jgi:hypothetical protein
VHLVVCFGPGSPWHFSHFAEKAPGATRFLDFFKALWYFAVLGKHLELSEGQVAKAMVPSKELQLVVAGAFCVV